MARIRTVKPEFFRHETLQELEIRNQGKYPMLVFCGLWGHCDRNGSFEWRPRYLKLDILPFLDFDMDETLALLEGAKLVLKYDANGRIYGWIPSFKSHQIISGKEASASGKYPEPTGEQKGKCLGSDRENPGSIREVSEQHPGKQEGKGKERNKTIAPSGAFELFWAAYPKRKSRGQAERAWSKINPNEQLTAEILAGVERAKTSAEWVKDDGQFIPYPASWLNAKGWLDEAGETSAATGEVI
jgi:hypothetical protein